jgi:Ni2+-binding GTPase involved in maturation of urease and hydrogenase
VTHVALLGAGRGGILISIARAIKIIKKTNPKIEIADIIIVEKNKNCLFSL